jgi:hypothetical protein
MDDDCGRCPFGVLSGAVACCAIDALQAFPCFVGCGAREFTGRERIGFQSDPKGSPSARAGVQ